MALKFMDVEKTKILKNKMVRIGVTIYMLAQG